VLLAVALAVLAPGCGRRPVAPSGTDALVLVTIDTLRGDRLGVTGDAAARTPYLDRLARGGTQFAVALSPVPLTLPAHATILSGRLPPDHGARDNGLFRVRDDIPLLAEVLETAGFRTAAFLAAYPLAARFGLARGFGSYHDSLGVREGESSFAERPANEVTDEVITWLEGTRANGPVFLWVHYFDPHAPYEPPRPRAAASGGDAYRGEVAFADGQLGRLVRAAERRFAHVKVCCVGDHGESLGEHGEETHGIFVYESTTRVPLLFHGPGAPVRLEPASVSLTGVAATLASWAGVDPEGLGRPLPLEEAARPAGADAEPLYVESMYPELRHGWAPLRGLRTERWKVIRAPEPEIYDLATDPAESRNLWEDPAVRERVAGLFDELEDPRWEAAAPAGTPDPEVEEALRSLGYAGAQEPRDEAAGPLPDPKERIRLERWLGLAGGALEAGNLPAARRAISRALSVDSRSKEANLLRARLEAASGSLDQALNLFDYCRGLPPASLDSEVWYAQGNVELEAGRLEDAERSYGQAVRADPLSVDARFNWGLAAYRAGRTRDAIERWREVLQADPHHSHALRALPEAEARLAGEETP